jgi:hypothetical protein
MKAAAFEELLTSVRQAGEIRRGRRKPARATTFKPADVKAVPPTEEHADMLASRLKFIRDQLVTVDPASLESDV